jgi:AcrR family transcriptional regulator
MRRKITGKRRNDPAGLRARILDTSAALFQKNGYHSTSMLDLIEATRVTSGALHHHFPTKKSLALAVLTERIGPTVREAWIDPVRHARDLGAGVAQAFGSIIAGIHERGAVFGCPLNNLALELALNDVDFRRCIDDVFSEWRSVLIERISATRGGVRLGSAEQEAAANFIISVYSGAMNLAKAGQRATPLVDAAKLVASWLHERRLDS